MDPGPALSSTPRKTIGKPILRLSIPTPNAQFASPKGRPSESSSTTFNVTQPTNRSTIANGQNDNRVDNSNGCPHDETNAENKNNQSEVEKLIRSERFAQPSKCRSDGASASPLANGFGKMSPQRDSDAADGDDNGSPSYKSFESDFRRRIDEMNAANRFEMRLKGNDLDLFSIFFFCLFNRCQSVVLVNWQLMFSRVRISILHSERSPLFSHIKTMSSSTPNTPSRTSPKPQFSRIISLSPTIHYSIEENATVSDIETIYLFIYFVS